MEKYSNIVTEHSQKSKSKNGRTLQEDDGIRGNIRDKYLTLTDYDNRSKFIYPRKTRR